MTTSVRVAVVALWIGLSAYSLSAQQPAALTVVQSGPTNEIQSLREANEIRVVFSEPMVVLGRIPDPVTAPFVTIRPAIQGTFRWSGTTILIFTPDPSRKLPNATQYDVTVDTSAVAVSGRRGIPVRRMDVAPEGPEATLRRAGAGRAYTVYLTIVEAREGVR